MIYNQFDIDRIHRKAIAITGQYYTILNGFTYIGTADNHLRLLSPAEEVIFKATTNVPPDNAQAAIEYVSNNSGMLELLSIVSGICNGTNTIFVFNKPPKMVLNTGMVKVLNTGYIQNGTLVQFIDVPQTGDIVTAYK